MILYVGGRAQGQEALANEIHGTDCRLVLHPEKMIRERLRMGSSSAEVAAEAAAVTPTEIVAEARAEIAADAPTGTVAGVPAETATATLTGNTADAPAEIADIVSSVLTEILAQEQTGKPLVVVSDLVGCGVIPVDPQEERYREAVGRLQVKLAEQAEEVWRVTCGIPERLK